VSTRRIEVACVLDLTGGSDVDYALFFAILLVSMARNHRSGEPLRVWVLCRGVQPEVRSRIEAPLAGSGMDVEWLEIEDETLERLAIAEVYRRLTPHYLKLIIPDLLPPDMSRVLYFDTDFLVLGEVSRLWSVDLGGAVAGCCADPFQRTLGRSSIRPDCSLAERLEFLRGRGLDPEASYLNSGVMLIDLPRWRQEEIKRRVVEYSMQYPARNQEQDGLNVILAGRWRKLDSPWNVYPRLAEAFDEPPPELPYAIHFAWYKPTEEDYVSRYVESPSKVVFQRLFFEYLDQTSFSGGAR